VNRTTHRHRVAGLALIAWVASAPRVAADPMVGDVDDFEGAHAWEGHVEVIPCSSCAFPPFPCLCPPGGELQGASTQSGGPAGLFDTYLLLSRLPSHGIETWNLATNRTGNYIDNDVGSIELDLNNFGTEALAVRVGLERGSTRWVTSDAAAVALPAASGWLPESSRFELTVADMTCVAGSDSLQFVLESVEEIRLLHAQEAQWSGDDGLSLGIDNVELPEPGGNLALGCAAALLAVLGRRQLRRSQGSA
jgi:hypothetical protein